MGYRVNVQMVQMDLLNQQSLLLIKSTYLCPSGLLHAAGAHIVNAGRFSVCVRERERNKQAECYTPQ